jgi:hypothetical protein
MVLSVVAFRSIFGNCNILIPPLISVSYSIVMSLNVWYCLSLLVVCLKSTSHFVISCSTKNHQLTITYIWYM